MSGDETWLVREKEKQLKKAENKEEALKDHISNILKKAKSSEEGRQGMAKDLLERVRGNRGTRLDDVMRDARAGFSNPDEGDPDRPTGYEEDRYWDND